ncbi:PDR/VanB family oxidoreductase [Nocardioides zeae]|uniref:Ferredoxin-NADP reductase n=1 Tax=Nocardioides zeae TaxID=1457234 RepID=A0AAJ1U715_9ACTN|nr:PDR/VanB family oxidoreductase [Nocardioides zeae]MDQ1105686.1 ferredoxin-NADP reductase [Nocardioides zeae]
MPTPETIELVVLDKETVAVDTVRLTLGRPDRGPLPPWEPGAHIDLHLGSDPALVRQYSLCSSPADPDRYEVAVLRDPASRGGSAHVVDRLGPGDVVPVSHPRNHFALVPARRYVFVAGGIGITPVLPMIAAVAATGADWSLLYGGRTRASMAFADELVEAWGDRVSIRPQDEHGLLDLDGLLAVPQPDTAIYCCGPAPLLDAVEVASAAWPPGTLHLERFAPVALPATTEDDGAFEVEFARTGVTLTVPADRSIMEVAEDAGVPIMYSCEEGTCGSCEVPVLAGEPDHRDFVLTPEEREASRSMMICVGRARSPRLVLDA